MQTSFSEALPLFAWRTPAAASPAAKPRVDLRPYQVEALGAIRSCLESKRSTLLVMATGLGKTTVFGSAAVEWPGRVLILAHREELISQAAARLRAMGAGRVATEQASSYAGRDARCVVGSVQTLKGERLTSWPRDHFGLVIVDEAHHAVADSYRKILDHFTAAKVLGVTATPDRADDLAMGLVFESVAFKYDIADGIAGGWLCPIRVQTVQVEAIDLSGVKTVAGDLNQGQLAKVMEAEEALHGVARPVLELAGDRRTIVFATSVANAERMAEILCRYRPQSARFVSGETPTLERRRILTDHQAGRFQYLVNVGVLTEGYDDPGVACIAMARPTKSRALYTQCAGRGLRPAPGKVDCLLLDFVGNAGRHQLISAVDVLGGKYPEDVVKRAKKIAEKAPGGMLAEEALAKAAAEIEAKRQREAAKRLGLKAQVSYKTNVVDPFAVLHMDRPKDDGLPFRPADVRQLKQLADFKVPCDSKGLSYAEAAKLLQTVWVRKHKGLATFGQMKALATAGIDASRMRVGTASRVMDALVRNKQATGKWGLTPDQLKVAIGGGRIVGEDG